MGEMGINKILSLVTFVGIFRLTRPGVNCGLVYWSGHRALYRCCISLAKL